MSHQQPDAAELLDALIEGLAQRVTDRLAQKLRELQPKPPPQEVSYLNERAVAQRIGISTKTLQEWRYHGHGPPYKRAGRRVLYSIDAIQEWLSAGGRNGTEADVSAPLPRRRARRAALQEVTREA